MKRRFLLKAISLGTAGAAFSLSYPSLRSAVLAEEDNPHWGYEGDVGPEQWGELSEEFQTCKIGRQQSPIDLRDAIDAELDFEIIYQDIPLQTSLCEQFCCNNGHSIQIDAPPDGNRITLDGQNFNLVQFHFHHPSEHTVNGQRYPMETHFVYQSENGQLVVLGVFMKEGTENTALQPVWNAFRHETNAKYSGGDNVVSMGKILPADRSFYHYLGSLTTPPCSEIVRWVVFQTPIEVSKTQISQFSQIFPSNARPIQSGNRRFLLKS